MEQHRHTCTFFYDNFFLYQIAVSHKDSLKDRDCRQTDGKIGTIFIKYIIVIISSAQIVKKTQDLSSICSRIIYGFIIMILFYCLFSKLLCGNRKSMIKRINKVASHVDIVVFNKVVRPPASLFFTFIDYYRSPVRQYNNCPISKTPHM